MAWIWHLTASFGDRESDARAFLTDFRTEETISVPSHPTVYLRGSVYRTHHDPRSWECSITPFLTAEQPSLDYLNGWGGPSNATEVADLDAAAKVLYDRLRERGKGYDFALVGVEVSDWRHPDELANELSPDGSFRSIETPLEGLVISKAMWERTEQPPNFEPFGEEFMWQPFRTSADDRSP